MYRIRTAYSDTVGIWHELPMLGTDEDHCAMAPLGDTTAIVAYAGQSGLAWAKVEGDRWTEQGVIDPRPWTAQHPRFAFRKSGGLWLLWTHKLQVFVSSYRDGAWIRTDSLTAVHPEGQTFNSAWCDPSLDGGERPLLVWGDLGFGFTYRDVGCIAFPTDSGWTRGEEIPGSDGLFLTPFVARDRNGDAWVAWRLRGSYTDRWTHTYVSATSSGPRVSPTGGARMVSWTLSEPAPESWWAVLRATDGGGYEEAARVQAGSGLDVSWTDGAVVADSVRYRIRRESVDKRYEWLSPETRFLPTGRPPLNFVGVPTPYLDGASLVLRGAAPGWLRLVLYDLQGRQVMRQSVLVGGSGEDRLVPDIRAPQSGPGVYFLKARDSAGNESRVVRLIYLR